MSTLNWTRKLSPFASSRLTYSIDDQTGIVTSQIHEDELGDLLRAAGYQLDDSDGPLRIDGTWLVREVEGCNCNGGDAASSGAHEPHCGLQPELNLATLDGFNQLGQYLDQRLADEAAALRSAPVATDCPVEGCYALAGHPDHCPSLPF